VVEGFVVGRRVERLGQARVQVVIVARDGGVVLIDWLRQQSVLLCLLNNSIDSNEF